MINQGKRPDQIKFSEDMVFYAILGMLSVMIITSLINILKNI